MVFGKASTDKVIGRPVLQPKDKKVILPDKYRLDNKKKFVKASTTKVINVPKKPIKRTVMSKENKILPTPQSSVLTTAARGSVNTGVGWLDNVLNGAIDVVETYGQGQQVQQQQQQEEQLNQEKDWFSENWFWLVGGVLLLLIRKKK